MKETNAHKENLKYAYYTVVAISEKRDYGATMGRSLGTSQQSAAG